MATDDDSEGEVIISDGETVIREEDYLEISQYIRTMFNIFPKIEKAKGRATKEALIWEDEENLNKQRETSGSFLLPLVSFAVNHPGFKYKTQELKEVGIYEFMDSVNRLNWYESVSALMGGMYSGFCDVSKVPKENFNFMRDLYTQEKKIMSQDTFKRVTENYQKS